MAPGVCLCAPEVVLHAAQALLRVVERAVCLGYALAAGVGGVLDLGLGALHGAPGLGDGLTCVRRPAARGFHDAAVGAQLLLVGCPHLGQAVLEGGLLAVEALDGGLRVGHVLARLARSIRLLGDDLLVASLDVLAARERAAVLVQGLGEGADPLLGAGVLARRLPHVPHGGKAALERGRRGARGTARGAYRPVLEALGAGVHLGGGVLGSGLTLVLARVPRLLAGALDLGALVERLFRGVPLVGHAISSQRCGRLASCGRASLLA